ncbi:hypothetical protein [Vibrio sp. D431a]|uniref:hypothetical protein n=1 Tax=Vibrio sp. D431a TaxID=2837388 RepID=UPI002553542B|nr:hypothetical protein [Vibrio sp. D431a]MDK9789799.1 hypothetical protein [Vibrio sp. D431a]
MENVKLPIDTYQAFRVLRNVYKSHLKQVYKLEPSLRELDELFSKFAGFTSFNHLSSSLREGSDIGISGEKLLLQKVMSLVLDVPPKRNVELFKIAYSAHFAADLSTPLKPSKLNKRFALLFDCDSQEEIMHLACNQALGLDLYIVSLRCNLSILRDNYDHIGFSLVYAILDRMTYQIPPETLLTKAFMREFVSEITINSFSSDQLLSRLKSMSTVSDFTTSIKEWIENVGVGIKLSDEKVVFVTPECSFVHTRVTRMRWAVSLKLKLEFDNEVLESRINRQAELVNSGAQTSVCRSTSEGEFLFSAYVY